MKRLIALMICAVSLGVAAQSTITYPFNPDANSDGFVGVSDILEGVATYDNFFSPGEIMIGDTALSDWIYHLQSLLELLEVDSNTANSNMSGENFVGLAFGEKVFWDLDTLSWISIDWPQMEVSSFEVNQDGLLYVTGTTNYVPYGLTILPPGELPCETLELCSGLEVSAIFNGNEYENYQYYDFNYSDADAMTIAVKKGQTVFLRRGPSTSNQRFEWTPLVQSSSEGVSNSENASDADAIEIPSYSLECVDMGYSPLCGALGFSQWATLEPNYLGHRYNMGWSGPDANNGYLIHDPHWRKFQIRGLPAGIGEIVVEYTNINGDHSFTGVALDFDGEGNAFIYLYATCYSGNSECSGLAIQQGVYDFPLESALGVEHCNASSMRNLKLHYSDGWSLVSLGLTIDIY